MLSDLARRTKSAWNWLWCRCHKHPREVAEVVPGVPEWQYSRCSSCGRAWLHFRDWNARVSASNPVLVGKEWRRL